MTIVGPQTRPRPWLWPAIAVVSLAVAVFSVACMQSVFAGPETSSSPVAPATQPATTQSAATQPQPYPSPALTREAEQAAEKLRTRTDGKLQIYVSAPFVIAGNMSAEQLKAHAAGSVIRPAEAMWKSYFKIKPDKIITILLFADEPSYRRWAKRLFDDTEVSYFGYYRPSDRTMVMNIATGGGTLVHELTHALIAYDWPGVPLWFNEGLASLHEQCRIEDDGIVGLPNWRLPALQKAIRAGTLRPLADLATKNDFYGPQRGANYAQARYFCQYLQSRDLLGKFYASYKAAHAKDTPADKVIAEVCGMSVEEVDAKARAYALGLVYKPAGR